MAGTDAPRALTLNAATAVIASPVEHHRLLDLIVETAAQVVGATAGALFLVDDDAQELRFEVALGGKAEEVGAYRVPLGHGVAGLVAVTGQPIAVSDGEEDPRLAREIAEGVGYLPSTLVCVPLFYGDAVIGVLELLDKHDGRFTPRDIEVLGLFARQAAVAIAQSQTRANLAALAAESDRAISAVAGDRVYRDALELAELVHAIAQHGEREAHACAALLRGFADYLNADVQPDLSP